MEKNYEDINATVSFSVLRSTGYLLLIIAHERMYLLSINTKEGGTKQNTCPVPTLRASLSGTFLQTLPDLVRGTLYLRAAVQRRGQRPLKGLGTDHTPNIAFRHLPPDSARFGYATEEVLFISAQLSTDAVSALRKVRVLI